MIGSNHYFSGRSFDARNVSWVETISWRIFFYISPLCTVKAVVNISFSTLYFSRTLFSILVLNRSVFGCLDHTKTANTVGRKIQVQVWKLPPFKIRCISVFRWCNLFNVCLRVSVVTTPKFLSIGISMNLIWSFNSFRIFPQALPSVFQESEFITDWYE